MEFDDLFNLTVFSLSRALASIAARNRYRDLVFESFGRPGVAVHNLMNNYGLKYGLSTRFEDLIRTKNSTGMLLVDPDKMKNMLHHVDEFLGKLKFTEELNPPNFWDMEKTLILELEAFKYSAPKLDAYNQGPNINYKIDKKIEWENPFLKLSLYRVITEAINNAITHGEAQNTDVILSRNKSSIELVIRNDGKPFELYNESKDRKKSRGIDYLFQEMDKWFGAQHSCEVGTDNIGTIIILSIPAIPLDNN